MISDFFSPNRVPSNFFTRVGDFLSLNYDFLIQSGSYIKFYSKYIIFSSFILYFLLLLTVPSVNLEKRYFYKTLIIEYARISWTDLSCLYGEFLISNLHIQIAVARSIDEKKINQYYKIHFLERIRKKISYINKN